MLVEIQAGQSLQVYDAKVTLTAQLGGLRWFMYRWRLTAFALFTSAFWVVAMAVTVIVFAVPLRAAAEVILGGPSGSGGDIDGYELGHLPLPKNEGDNMSDTSRTFPSTSKQPALKYEAKVKQEEVDEGMSDIEVANPGAEADDETSDFDDEQSDMRDSGIGTSYSDNRNREGTRKRSSRSRVPGAPVGDT
jgi:hypothetical protein